MSHTKAGFNTLSIHAGECHPGSEYAHVNPIFQSSTYSFPNIENGGKVFKGEEFGYIYSRVGNPNMTVLENKIAALEGSGITEKRHAEGDKDFQVVGLSFSSGMAAISSTLMGLLEPGDTFIAQTSLYGGTIDLFNNTFTKYKLTAIWVNDGDVASFEKAVQDNPKAKLIYIETPGNPMLTIVDIEAIAKLAHDHNMVLIVDNTFATPYLQRPLELGADYVIHSMTKYIGGHGTSVGGMVVSPHSEIMYTEIIENRHHIGGNPGPMDSWLINMGVKTLPLRMDKHCDNTEVLVDYLLNHPKVGLVLFPGLKNHPNYEIAKKQMSRYGGMISFELKGGLKAGAILMDSVKLMTLAVSLGAIDTLIQHPASLTHSNIPKEHREKAGITDGLVRLSVGLENIEDLIADFDQALAKV
jgi:methionine-gamma-lyase